MMDRLKKNFFKLGVFALLAFIISRFLTSILLAWFSNSGWLDATNGNTTAYVSLYTIADLLHFLSMILWGLFFLGFALRAIELLEERSTR